MLISERIDDFIRRLEENTSLKVIKGYPYAKKPTFLSRSVVVVSLGEVEAENIELGGEKLYGRCRIVATIYVPTCDNYDITNGIAEVVHAQLSAYPSAISVSGVSADDRIECLKASCSFTFYDEVNFGGVLNEQ